MPPKTVVVAGAIISVAQPNDVRRLRFAVQLLRWHWEVLLDWRPEHKIRLSL